MNLKVINSNSKGNCYILEGENSALLIECGVPYPQILEAIDHKIIKIDACVLTHEHGDHSKAYRHIGMAGIPIVSSPGTYEALNFPPENRTHKIYHGKTMFVKGWTISAFNVEHDAKEPVGFIIEHPDCGRVLFVTDTFILKYEFQGSFDHIIIESNYCERLRDEWIERKGKDFVEGRRLKSHMSFQTALHTVQKLDTTNTKNIVLIHLSDGLTNEKRF